MKLGKGIKIQTAFDEYCLTEKKGEGGNGQVYAAINLSGEEFAIKFIEKNIGKEKLKRFRNEIGFCEKHSHKNIVPILDRGIVSIGEKILFFM